MKSVVLPLGIASITAVLAVGGVTLGGPGPRGEEPVRGAAPIPETEPNNDTSIANPVSLGDTVVGVANGSDVDWFTITLTQGTWLELSATSGFFHFRNWHPSSLVAEGQRLVFRIGETGRYYAGLHHAGSTQYAARFVTPPEHWIYEEESEPNDATPIPVSVGDTIAGFVGDAGDVDHFVIDLVENTWVRFTTINVGAALYGPDGDTVFVGRGVRVWVRTTGRYDLYVRDPQGTDHPWRSYYVQITADSPEGEWLVETEPNDELAQATLLHVDDPPTYGRIDPPDDVDYLSFDLTEDTWVVIRRAGFTQDGYLPDGTEVPFRLFEPYHVIRTGRHSLRFHDPSGNARNWQNYTAQVVSHEFPPGYVTEDEPNDSVPNQLPLRDAVVVGVIDHAFEQDRYEITVPAGVYPRITTELEEGFPGQPSFRFVNNCPATPPGPRTCTLRIYYESNGSRTGFTPDLIYNFRVRLDVSLEVDALVDHLLWGEVLTAEEISLADLVGNANGSFDAGDVRAALQRDGQLGAAPPSNGGANDE